MFDEYSSVDSKQQTSVLMYSTVKTAIRIFKPRLKVWHSKHKHAASHKICAPEYACKKHGYLAKRNIMLLSRNVCGKMQTDDDLFIYKHPLLVITEISCYIIIEE